MKTVVTIAGLDPTGGAGLLADVETIHRLGARARAVATTLTAQPLDPTPPFSAMTNDPVAPAIVRRQLKAAFAAGPVHAVKIGALGSAAVVEVVATEIAALGDVPIVIDPVFRASSGLQLLDDAGQQRWVAQLLSQATLVTPNLQEARRLCFLLGHPLGETTEIAQMNNDIAQMNNDIAQMNNDIAQMNNDIAQMNNDAQRQLAGRIIIDGARNPELLVLIKGGHGDGDRIVDTLVSATATLTHEHERVDATAARLRGTGCRLSTAIATHLAAAAGSPATPAQQMERAWRNATTDLVRYLAQP